MKEELRIHEEMAKEEAAHWDAPDPANQARLAMGNTLQAQENARAVWISPRLDGIWQDVRLAVRQLRRATVFATTAITMAGLGIGALAIVFSVVNVLFLVPLPFPDSTEILTLVTADGGGVDGATFHAAKNRLSGAATVAAQSRTPGWNFAAGEHSEFVPGLRISSDYFDVIGIQPMIGRGFTPSEDSAGGHDVVIVSFDLWQRAMRGQGGAIGQDVSLGGSRHQVVGVMPETFRSVPPADVFVPLRLSAVDNSANYLLLARFQSDLLPQQRQALQNVLQTDLLSLHSPAAQPRIRSLGWVRLQDTIGREPLLMSLILVVAVGFVVFIACTNIAGLQLLRTAARHHELASRMALGGSRGRIVQQLLTETLVLGGVGGVLGVALTAATVPLLNRLLPPELLVGRSVSVDWRVVAFAVALAVCVSMFFGIAPAIAVRRVDLRQLLAANHRTGHSGVSGWWRRGLLAGQLAATMALLIITGMLITHVRAMYDAPLGFDPDGVIVVKMSLQGRSLEGPEQAQAFADRVLPRLHALPTVQAVALANHVPVERGLNLALAPPAGSRIEQIRSVDWRCVTSDYFSALNIAVRRGRTFAAGDRGGAAIAVVNESFARTYFGTSDAIGRVIALAPAMKDSAREIVGVVADVRSRPGAGWTRGFSALGADPPPTVYVPFDQMSNAALSIAQRFYPMVWVVRGNDTGGNLERQIVDVFRSIDQHTPVIQISPMAALVASDVSGSRAITAAVSAFAVVALLIACIGVYGLVAYSATQRSRETAVRVALGANRPALIRAFLTEMSLIAMVSVLIGLGGILTLSRTIAATLGPVGTLRFETVVPVALLLLTVLAIAGLIPARRASQADPLQLLRLE